MKNEYLCDHVAYIVIVLQCDFLVFFAFFFFFISLLCGTPRYKRGYGCANSNSATQKADSIIELCNDMKKERNKENMADRV